MNLKWENFAVVVKIIDAFFCYNVLYAFG